MRALAVLASVNLLGGFISGYNSGIIAGILGIFNEKKDSEWYLSEAMQGIVTASILIGAFFGSVIGGPISDQFGRKTGVCLLSIFTLVGAPLLAVAPNVNAVIGFRTMLGVGVGMTGVVCPRYVSETAPKERKGALGIFYQLAVTVGILIAYIANYALEKVEDNWRIMFGLGALPGLFLLVVGVIMPESPEWQSRKLPDTNGYEGSPLMGDRDRLILVNRSTGAPPPPDDFYSTSYRLYLLLKSRALYIGLVLAVAQQLTGINAFMYYAKNVFTTAGIKNPNFPTIGLGAWNAITTVIAIPMVDRLGRRPLLIVGTSIMSVACFGLGLVYKFVEQEDVRGPLAIVLLLIFVAAFEVGDGPLFWIVAHELFTPEVKTIGSTILNAAVWLFNIALCLGFPILQAKINEVVFYIFGAFGIVCSLIMIVALPETRPLLQ